MNLNDNDIIFIDNMIEEYNNTKSLVDKLIISHSVMAHIMFLRRLYKDGKN